MMAEALQPDNAPHLSVLRDEVVEYMAPRDGGVYVDGTFGGGGHTRALLDAADCHVYGLDQDAHVTDFAETITAEYPQRFTFIQGKFGDMEALLSERGISKVDGILLDIGVSSMQLDTAERGFSFSHDGPLDMRMGQHGTSAQEFVNQAQEKELADVIYRYGDERKSRRIAHAIVEARSEEEITRTGQLAEIVRRAVKRYDDTIHPATRTFQALRIWVNDELGELERVLASAERLLAPEGRLLVITFHSGEDSIVKRFIRDRARADAGTSRHHLMQGDTTPKTPIFTEVKRKVITPTDEELKYNIRARSAKLRVAQRTDAPTGGQATSQGGYHD